MKHRVKLFEYFEGDEADHLRDVGLLGPPRLRCTLSGRTYPYKQDDPSFKPETRIMYEIKMLKEYYDDTLEVESLDVVPEQVKDTLFHDITVVFNTAATQKIVHDWVLLNMKYFYSLAKYTLKFEKCDAK